MILTLVVLLTVMPMGTVFALDNTAEFAGGSGTKEDPYLISNTKHLNNVRNYLNAYFELLNDIEFTTEDFEKGGAFYNNGEGFEPIGKGKTTSFTGRFDGKGYIIKNLVINTKINDEPIGLFRYNYGVIENFGVIDGGISAINEVSSETYVGGIVGYNFGKIGNCYNTGDVSGSARSGGIVGWNVETIENCYNEGCVSGSGNSGGIAGGISGSNTGTITNCYNIGGVSVSATGHAEAIVGVAYSGTIENCYYLEGLNDSTYGTECSFEDMKVQNTYVGFDFDLV